MLPAWVTQGVRGYVRRFGPGRDGAVPGAALVPDPTKFLNEEGEFVVPPSGSGTPATTVTDETTYGIAPAVGVDTEYARQDHTHGSPAAPTAGSVGADPAGTSVAGIAAHVAAGDPHPAYALEAALGTASALNAATTRASGGIVKLGTNFLYGIDELVAHLGYHIAYTRAAAGSNDNSGWGNPSVSGSSGSQSNNRWLRSTSATSSGWFQGTRLADTAEGFVVAICFKFPATIGARRFYVGLCSTSIADSDTPSGHFVGLRYSSTAPDAGFVPASRDGVTPTIGAAFAAPVADVPYLAIFTGAAGGSVVVELIRLDTGTRETATISATLPAGGTKIDIVVYTWNQGVSKALEMSSMYRYLPML